MCYLRGRQLLFFKSHRDTVSAQGSCRPGEIGIWFLTYTSWQPFRHFRTGLALLFARSLLLPSDSCICIPPKEASSGFLLACTCLVHPEKPHHHSHHVVILPDQLGSLRGWERLPALPAIPGEKVVEKPRIMTPPSEADDDDGEAAERGIGSDMLEVENMRETATQFKKDFFLVYGLAVAADWLQVCDDETLDQRPSELGNEERKRGVREEAWVHSLT